MMGGEIHESACSIHTDDIWQEIKFDTVSHHTLTKATTNITRPVKIRLINCSLQKANGELWRNVSMTFDGVKDHSSPDLFSVNGNAQGVGLRITSFNGHSTKPGESLPPEDLKDAENELKYTLNLVRNGDEFKEGDWFSVIRFVVAYQ